MAKYDDLKAMREQRDGVKTAEEKATEEQRKEENKRLLAGEPVGGTAPDPDDNDDDDTNDGDETPPDGEQQAAGDGDGDGETVPVRAHERKKSDKKDETTVAPPGTEAVEIDGKTVYVAPELAAAFREVESGKATAAKEAETDALADRVAAKLRTTAPPTTDGVKSAAEVAAEKALTDAEAEAAKVPPEPAAELWISDPGAAQKQLTARNDALADLKVKKALAERDLRDATAAREAQAKSDEQLEAQARVALTDQFYSEYKVLADPSTRKLVDVLLTAKWNEIRDYVAKRPFKTQAEGQAFKKKCFTEVAADATRQIVAIQQQGKKDVAPPAPPPNLAQSRTREVGKPATKPAEKPKEKYPSGSVSAMLAKHKDTKLKPKGATA